MRLVLGSVLALGMAAHAWGDDGSTEPPQEEPKPKPAAPADDGFKVYWKEGLRIDSADKNFRFRIGGRIMNDWVWFTHDDEIQDPNPTGLGIGDQQDGTEFRRSRLYIRGDIYENGYFKMQYDFAGGDADFKDVYVGLRNLPLVGHLQVGHYYEPFSLDQMTSDKYSTFIERAAPATVFAPGRNTGIMVFDTAMEDRMTWAVGLFKTTDDYGDVEAEGEATAVTARVTGLPLLEEDGRHLVHLGVSVSGRSPGEADVDPTAGVNVTDAVRYRERPEVHLADRWVDTGVFEADRQIHYALEAALVWESFSLQGEFLQGMVDSDPGDDPVFTGYYVQASWFPTGEHRPYKQSGGKFGRVQPLNPFTGGSGTGAVELGIRYSFLDLEDGLVMGGEMETITFGVNWHLDANIRIVADVIRARVEDQVAPGVTEEGEGTALAMRFQVDF